MGKGNMYDFSETWNPLGGECSHKCSYCYRKNMMRFPINKEKYLGKPRLFYGKSGMNKNLGNGNFWFVGSMTDIFADNVPNEMIIKILEYCNKYPSNQYLFQSKNPQRFKQFLNKFPEDTILCTTIESNRASLFYAISGGQTFSDRSDAMEDLSEIFPIMITIEPIIDFDINDLLYWFELIGDIKQINIGADTGNNNLPEPPKEKILELIEKLEEFTTVHQKDNLKRLLK